MDELTAQILVLGLLTLAFFGYASYRANRDASEKKRKDRDQPPLL